MKNFLLLVSLALFLLLVSLTLILGSCTHTWDSETKDMFYQSCLEEAHWAETQDLKEAYCRCVLDRTIEKYPSMSEALKNIEKVIDDEYIRACRSEFDPES